MARVPSPLHQKPVPKRVSKPTLTAEAAANVAETVVAAETPAPVAKPAKKTKAKAAVVAAKSKPAAAVGKKSAAKPAAAPQAAEPAPAKPAKAHKHKLVRDSFTMPKDEYQVIDELKQRALTLHKHVRKSELLRAGIRALAELNDRALLKALAAVPTLKTGRPKGG